MVSNLDKKINRVDRRSSKEIRIYRRIRKNFSFLLIGVLVIGFALNYTSTAKYTQAFDPAIQTITAAPWEVDSSIEHNGKSVHEQVISNFKPGDIKTNLIKFANKNNYDTTFFLEVTPIQCDENNNLFLNPNIEFILKVNNEDGLEESETTLWQEVIKDQENKVYKYEINIPAAESGNEKVASYQMDIKWNHGENDWSYVNKSGKINYKVIAEQTIIEEEDNKVSEE